MTTPVAPFEWPTGLSKTCPDQVFYWDQSPGDNLRTWTPEELGSTSREERYILGEWWRVATYREFWKIKNQIADGEPTERFYTDKNGQMWVPRDQG